MTNATIVVTFHVDADDLKQSLETLYGTRSQGPVHDLSLFLQDLLYDSENGPILEGHYEITSWVIETRKTRDELDEELDSLCEDYSCGKPSAEDVKHYAEMVAGRYKVSFAIDDEGSVRWFGKNVAK